MDAMKKTASVIYTVFVVVALLGVIAFFGWKTYQSREKRISDFVARTEDYTGRLSRALDDRDVDGEVDLAKRLMDDDLSLVAVQVFSHDDGLRLSVVKPVAGDFSRRPIAGSGAFDGPLARIRFHQITRPMAVSDMQGLEAVYVAAVLSDGEIRNNLMIILVTVVGLFVITLVLVLLRPGTRGEIDRNEDREDGDFSLDHEFSAADDAPMNDDFGIEAPSDDEFNVQDDFDSIDSLDETDLLGGGPDFGDSLPMEDDFELPNLDDFPSTEPVSAANADGFLDRLESELERAASFNQDLSVLLFSLDGESGDSLKSSFAFPDLVFTLDGGGIAVIEINKDLDASLAFAENLVRDHIEYEGRRTMRAGIASRNGRLISARRLMTEAEGALRKTDAEKNIVAFRSDPEKYREYLKAQEG